MVQVMVVLAMENEEYVLEAQVKVSVVLVQVLEIQEAMALVLKAALALEEAFVLAYSTLQP